MDFEHNTNIILIYYTFIGDLMSHFLAQYPHFYI